MKLSVESSPFLNYLKEHLGLFATLDVLDDEINSVINICVSSLQNGGKLLFCGNGGSAADSQHLAAEFTGRFINDRKPIAALSLTTDTSALTCIGNDYNFSDIFLRQLLALGKDGDCLFAISTSGNSSNVIQAVKVAKSMGIHTIGLLGNNGGELSKLCEYKIIIPSNTTARIQEAHILIGHSICRGVEIGLNI